MSKIVCEICGTKYPASNGECPICGYTNGAAAPVASEEIPAVEETVIQAEAAEKVEVPAQEQTEAAEEESWEALLAYHVGEVDVTEQKADEDIEVEDDDDEDDDDEEDDDEEESGRKSGVLLNILLVIVILALLCVTGFIFVKYFMPNMIGGKETVPPTDPPQIVTEAPETEEPTVPCAELVLEYFDIEMSKIGQMYLLNVEVQPADTTDTLTFVSSDENVLTVNEEGRITVIGEGSAIVTITCGAQSVECNVSVVLPTEEPTEAPTEEPTEEPTEAPTEAPTEPLKDVKLEINGNTDVTFNGVGLTFTFKLKNGLTNEEVTWESENEKICTVDENGFLKTTGRGRTNVIVRYGDQEVTIIVRVK